MKPFEFLLALYVILAGLGLTIVIRSIGQMIEAREFIKTYWIHSCWVGFIFLIHITNWFAVWEFRHVTSWSIYQFILLLSLPTLLYLASHICVPEVLANGTRYDMREFFYKRHRVLMTLLALTMILNLVNDYVLHSTLQFSEVNFMRSIVLVIVSIGAISSSPRVQGFIVVVLASIVAWSLGYLDNTIS
jgi:hypothetical protein